MDTAERQIKQFDLSNFENTSLTTSAAPASDTVPFVEVTTSDAEIIQPRQPLIRSSYVADLNRCPRYFMWRDRWGLKRSGFHASALWLGTFYHEMMASVCRGNAIREAVSETSDLIVVYEQALNEQADENGLLPNGKAVEAILASSQQEFDKAAMMFEVSVERFLFAPFMEAEGWQALLVEVPLQVKLAALPLAIRCKPDVVFIRPDDGALMIADHKTTSKDPRSLAASYSYAIQPRILHLAVKAFQETYATKQGPIYFLHNVIRKPTIKYCPDTKDKEGFEAYVERGRLWYSDQELKEPDNPLLLQSRLTLPDNPMTPELFERLRHTSAASACACVPSQYWRNENACLGPYGNSLCQFYPLCSAPVDEWPQTISRFYVQSFREDDEGDIEEVEI